MLITIDNYYDISFYRECKAALDNNGVEYKEYILSIAPYSFYFEVDQSPTFINYDIASKTQTRNMTGIVRPVTTSDEYKYIRDTSFAAVKGIKRYAINDALDASQKTKEGVMFSSTIASVAKLSKDFPRKIYYLGSYFNNKYDIFLSDSLMIKPFLPPNAMLLVEKKGFKLATDLEVALNNDTFQHKTRLVKLSQTPYFHKGNYTESNIPIDLRSVFTKV